jgi:hypothetical protein
LALAAVQDLRARNAPLTEDEVADFEVDVLAGFVMARASAGMADSTIRNDSNHLELVRRWFGGPLWEMQAEDADVYFGSRRRGDVDPARRAPRRERRQRRPHILRRTPHRRPTRPPPRAVSSGVRARPRRRGGVGQRP